MKHVMTTILLCTVFSAASMGQDYTWTKLEVPNGDAIRCAAIGPQDQVYVGMNNGQYVLKTTDMGANWEETHCFSYETENTPDVYDIEVSPSGIVWASVTAGYSGWISQLLCGLCRSMDGGNTWTWESQNPYCDTWWMHMAPNGDIYVGGYDGAVYIYNNGAGGEYLGPWYNFGEVPPYGNSLGDCVISNVYLYVYMDDEWHSFTDRKSYCYNIDNLQYIYYADVSSNGDVYRSVDKGDTWVQIRDTNTQVTEIEIDNNNYLYLATADGMAYSKDHGNTWKAGGLNGKKITSLDYNGKGNLVAVVNILGTNYVYFGQNNVIDGYVGFMQPAFAGYELSMLNEFEIRWNWLGNIGDQVRLDLYEDHVFKRNITEQTANDGEYDWIVTRHSNEASNYQFKITSLTNPAINAYSPIFNILEQYNYKQFKSYEAPGISAEFVPVIDGNLNDSLWDQVTEKDTLNYGGSVGAYQTAWDQWPDAHVTWKAVWCDATNEVYVAVEVMDDIRGNFDNGPETAQYATYDDESIEIMVDGNFNGGNYWGDIGEGQYWRVTGYNHVNLLHYPATGAESAYGGDDFDSAVQLGANGDWTCEMAFPIYDVYDSDVRDLTEGDMIGWDLWYNDSDNETSAGSYFTQDHQVGWCYLGPAWKESDYSGDLILGAMGSFITTTADVDIVTHPVQAGYTVDGVSCSGDQTFTWDVGSSHTVAGNDVVPVDATHQYTFGSWSDGGAQSHDITVTESMGTLTLNYQPQYLLQTAVHNSVGGSVGHDGENDWFDDGETATVTATPDEASGYVFKEWTGDASGSVNPFTVLMDAPKAITAVFEQASAVQCAEIPDAFDMKQNVPNPFNPETRIDYQLPEAGEVTIEVFDLTGRKVRTLIRENAQPGSYQILWDGRSDDGRTVSSGTYIYIMRCGSYQQRMKAIFLK